MLNSNKFKRFFCVAITGLLLLGCQDSGMSDLKRFVDEAFKNEKPDIPPLPPIIPFQKFEYAVSKDNDPFSLTNIVSEGGGGIGIAAGERPDQGRRKEELENYPLDALRMVGTLSKQGKPWVVVKTTQGSVLLATVGNYAGENYGRIKNISIEEQVVVLTETVPDPSGRWVTREVKMTVDEQ